MTKTKIGLLLLLLSLCGGARGQIGHLMNFDNRLLHFGIQVGYVSSKFDLVYTDDESIRALLQDATSYYSPGFHVAVIGDLRLTRFLNLRLLPGVSLLNRDINYSWSEAYAATNHLLEPKRTVESVYGDLPIELKFRSMRWENFRPYLTAGVSYGFDFASLKKNKNNSDESIIRLNSSDFRYSMGVGFDCFLRYVKFALELKMSFGIPNLIVPDESDIYTSGTTVLKSRTFLLGFTFEG